MMEFETRKTAIEKTDAILEDPRLIVGIGVKENEVEIISLNTLYSLPEKERIAIKIPVINDDKNAIKSVQQIRLENGRALMIVEVAGMFTADVEAVAAKIMKKMFLYNLKDGFFPACAERKTVFFIGNSINDLQPMPADVKNIRILDEKFLLFTDGSRLMKTSVDNLMNRTDWRRYALPMWLFNDKDISYVGRIKKEYIPVTLEDGSAFKFDIAAAKPWRTSAISRIDAYIGEIVKGVEAAVINTELLLFHPTLRPTPAVAGQSS